MDKHDIFNKISKLFSSEIDRKYALIITKYIIDNKDFLDIILFDSLRNIPGIDENISEEKMLFIAMALCNSDPQILQTEYEFLLDDDSDSIQISKDQLTEAFKTKRLFIPETGEEYEDFENHVFMHFVLGSLFNENCDV